MGNVKSIVNFHLVVRPHSFSKNSSALVKSSHSWKAVIITCLVAALPFLLHQARNIEPAWSLKSLVSAFRLPLSWSAVEISSSSKRLSKSPFSRPALCVIRRMSLLESFCEPKINTGNKVKKVHAVFFDFNYVQLFQAEMRTSANIIILSLECRIFFSFCESPVSVTYSTENTTIRPNPIKCAWSILQL